MRVDYNGKFGIGILALVVIIAVAAVTLSSCGKNEELGYTSETEDIISQLNFYDDNTGQKIDGKINVKFSPQGDNPSFQIENSYLITNEDDQIAILKHIMESDYYSQDVYGRTIDSMLIEWQVHNTLNDIYSHKRLRSVDFDKNSEDWTRNDYYNYAIKEWFKERS